jgi:hypothetical protein
MHLLPLDQTRIGIHTDTLTDTVTVLQRLVVDGGALCSASISVRSIAVHTACLHLSVVLDDLFVIVIRAIIPVVTLCLCLRLVIAQEQAVAAGAVGRCGRARHVEDYASGRHRHKG